MCSHRTSARLRHNSAGSRDTRTRSANRRTLDALRNFLPVPADGLAREFAAGATPDEICARTIRAVIDAGGRHFYISNLPIGRAQQVLASILERVGVTT